jgi:iduronate 2-sulfatase
MVRAPGKATGTSDLPVELIDLYPTLCELTGIPVPEHVKGKSFVAVLEDPGAAHRTSAYSSYLHGTVTGHSIRMGKYRYTEWYPKGATTPEAQVLTDLELDPGEESNVIDDPERKADLQKLRKELRERIEGAL